MKEVEGEPWYRITKDPVSPRYLMIPSAGVKEEGEEYGAIFFSEEAAMKALRFYLDEYLNGTETVYWRRHPEIVKDFGRYLRDTSFKSMENGYRFVKIETYIATCRVYAD